jgi:hypothetical protein
MIHLPHLVSPELGYFAVKCSEKKVGKVGNRVGKWEIEWESGKMTKIFGWQVMFDPLLRPWLCTFLEGTHFH